MQMSLKGELYYIFSINVIKSRVTLNSLQNEICDHSLKR